MKKQIKSTAPVVIVALMLGAIALVGLLTSMQLQQTAWDPAHHGVPGSRLLRELTLPSSPVSS